MLALCLNHRCHLLGQLEHYLVQVGRERAFPDEDFGEQDPAWMAVEIEEWTQKRVTPVSDEFCWADVMRPAQTIALAFYEDERQRKVMQGRITKKCGLVYD